MVSQTPDPTTSSSSSGVPNLELSPTAASSSSSEEPKEFLLDKSCYVDGTHLNTSSANNHQTQSSLVATDQALKGGSPPQLNDSVDGPLEGSEGASKSNESGQKLPTKVPDKIENPTTSRKKKNDDDDLDQHKLEQNVHSSPQKYKAKQPKNTSSAEGPSIIMSEEEELAKKQTKISELLAKAAPPRFSSAKDDPIVMSADVFASSSIFPPPTTTSHLDDDDEEMGEEDEESKTASYPNTSSLVRHSHSFAPFVSSWTTLIGLMTWDMLQLLILQAATNPWHQVPSLMHRILLLAWTGRGTSNSHATYSTLRQIRDDDDEYYSPDEHNQQQYFCFSAIPRQPSPPTYRPNVRGMRNFGQTCFLNVVLHGLASLDSVMAYVEWIALEQQQRQLRENQHRRPKHKKPATTATATTTVSEILLPLLHMANGRPGTIDPRDLLFRIAQKNTQFQSQRWGRSLHSSSNTTGEQQDAQELLQALLGMMVVDAQLEKGLEKASSYGEQRERPLEPSFFEEKKDDHSSGSSAGGGGYDSDNNLTVLSDRWSPRNSTCNSVVYESEEDDYGDDELFGNSHGSGEVIWNGMRMVDSTGKVSSCGANKAAADETQQQPRKVTDISPSTMDSMASSFLSTTSTVVTSPSNSSKQQQQSDANLSTSMQIMLSTISSITPSPLCGWEGSVLQCQACHHVRPIENSPFFMIPIVPTSMAMGSPGGVSKDSRPPPPCTLSQCLHFYTQMERVSDVECANCTLQKELQELDEEVDLLRGAVESLDRRRRQHQKQTKSPTNSTDIESNNNNDNAALREELKQAEIKLRHLQCLDPDNYEVGMDDSHPNAPSKLLRNEALKCLILTRCPSVLCLHVQRRYYDPVTDRMSKNMQHVIFDQILDLSPFCAYGGEKAASEFAGRGKGKHMNYNSDQAETKSSIQYRLTCVIEHKGNAFGGHYICYRRLPGQLQADSTLPKEYSKWYLCSDETIQPTTWQTVASCQAYMLLYEAV